MKLLVFLLGLMNLQATQTPTDPNTSQYQNLTLGMKFNYPKAWELTTNKQSESRILIPIENSSDRAVVEIFSVSFRSEPTVWQLSQVGINKTLKREVERQWDEEILGVPLLLTKVNYTEKGSSKTSETGLLYTFGFNKMMYRITAEPSEFEKADYLWRQVLQSLRTWDGEMPVAEDPTKKIERKEPVASKTGGFAPDEVPHPQIPHEINSRPVGKVIKAPVATTVEIEGKKVEIRVPADWKIESNKNGGFVLTTNGLSGPLSATIYPVAGSDPAGIALLKASGVTLAEFSKVANRDESLPKANRAGAAVGAIWRTGTGAKGELCTCDASCSGLDCYLLLAHRSESLAKWKEDRRLIESLLDRISIETAP